MSTSQATFEESTSTSGSVIARVRGIGFSWPRIAMMLAGIILAASVLFQYRSLTLHAPQYPGGLEVTIFTHKVVGDVSEVDGLNHYIGMMPLGEAAELERTIATPATLAIIILALGAAFMRAKWTSLLAAGVILFPIVFFVDLYFWLYKAGHDLDPTAALSSSVKPFTPAILGEGIVGQFSTTASLGFGFWLAVIAAVLAAAGIVGRLRQPSESGKS